MKNGLLVGVSAAAMVLGLAGRADAQASNNACGPVSASADPNVVSCISDPQKYPAGIVYNQADQALPPAGLLVDIYGTAVVQPSVNISAVQVIGSLNNLAEVNVRSGGTVTASGSGIGLSATASGTGLAELNIATGATIRANGGNLALLTTAGANGGGRVSNAGNVTAANTDGLQSRGAASLVLNTGAISSLGASAVTVTAGSTVINARGATLTGGTDPTFGYAVQFAGNGGTFNNYGSATGGTGGVTANTNLSNAGTGVTLNLYAGSTTGAINLIGGNDTVNLYTGTTTLLPDTAVDPVSGATVTVRAAGTYTAATTGTVSLGGGTNTVGLNGDGTGAAAGTLSLTGTGINTITKSGAGTWTLAGAANTTVPMGGAATSAATINAGTGGMPGSGGLLIFSGTGLTGAINVNGATIRATAAGGFGSGTINAIDPTIQYGATGTYANNIVLSSTAPGTDPTTLQADNGVTATLTGSITQSTSGQPLVFGLTTGAPANSTATFVLANATGTANNWTGVTTINSGVTLRGTTATISGGSIIDNGTLTFNQSTVGTNSRAIGGTGLVQIIGGGDVTLTGAITAGQGVQVAGGTIARLSNASGATGSEVTFTGAGASLFVANGGTISGTNGPAVNSAQTGNSVTNAGSITGNSTYTGVYFGGTSGTDTINNSGAISGFNAIDSFATTLNLTNSGSLTGLSAAGVYIDKAASVTNTGTITGLSDGQTIAAAIFASTGTINNNAGTISGNRGVQIQNGGTVNNAAQITGVTGTNGAAVRLVSGGNVTNFAAGTLTATATGARGIWTSGAGTLDNRGAINADTGIYSTSGAAVVLNSGTITAAVNGVQGAGTSLNLTNTNTIIGGTSAVRAEAAGSSITNSGTLRAATGGNGQGVYMTGGTLTNQNGGVISGAGTGAAIYLTGTANTLDLQAGSSVNGLIDASSTTDATGVYTVAGALNGGFTGGTGDDTLTLITGATVTGALDGNSGTDTLVLDGTGTNGALGSAQVVNFENLTKNNTGRWTLTGTTAASPTTVTVNAGTLAVAGGNALADAANVAVVGGATLALQAGETINALAGAGAVTLAANTLTVGGGNGGGTFSGVISGSGGLSKIGTGTQTLSGANSFTGATTVNAGTLALGASNVLADASAVTVASGATFDLRTNSDTVASLVLNGTLDGTGTLTAATYTLNAGTVNANLGGGTLTQASGTSLLNGTEAATSVAINGGTLTLGAADRLANGAAVTVAPGATLNVAGFNDAVDTLVLNGTLAGTGTLTASSYTLTDALVNANLGTGTLIQAGGVSTLNGTAAAGTVAINAGTLVLGTDERLADTAALTVEGSGILDLNDRTETVGTAVIRGTLNSSTTNSGTLIATTYTLDGGLFPASTTNPTINGNLGAGTLIVQGKGISTLNGTSAATAVQINGSTLRLGADERLADTAAVTVMDASNGPRRTTQGVLDIGTHVETVGTLQLTNSTLQGSGTLTAATYGLNGATVIANLGAGILTQQGGVSTLIGSAGAATVNVDAGTLLLADNDRLADNAAVTVATGAILDLSQYNDTVGTLALNGTLNGDGTLTATSYTLNAGTVNANLGTGTLVQAGGVSQLNGTAAAETVNVDAGTLTLGSSDRLADTAAVTVATGATLNIATFDDMVGTAAINGTLDGSGTLTAATYALMGATINANLGAGVLTQAGGTSTLNGTSAAETVNVNAGTLALGAIDRLADTAAVTVANGAVLDLATFSDTVGTLGLNGTLNGAGTLTASSYALNGATVNANLGAGVLTQTGGTSTLNGTEAATTVNITGGTLTLGASDRLADGAAVAVASGATLNIATFSDTVDTLALNGKLAGTGTLTAASYTLNGALVNANLGTGTLVQAGGTSTLNGTAAATMVGINAGTLTLGASDRLADNAALTVASGATLNLATFSDTVGTAALNGTLNGTGTLTAASYTLNGAAVNGNLGAGVLTNAGGTSTLTGTSAAATVNVDAGTLTLGASDRLADNAALTVATGATLNLATFNDTVGSALLNGTLAGTGTLTAATYTLNAATVAANLGAGTLTQASGTSLLGGTAGATTVAVNGGTLILGASNRLADAAAVTVATGATLDLGAFSDTVGTLALSGTVNGTGTLTAASYTLNGAAVNGNLGTGTLTQASGVSTLGGTAGATTVNVNGGTLALGAANRLADAAAVAVASGAVLDLRTFSDTVGTLALNGTLNGTGTLTAATYTLNGAAVNGNLGAGALVQAGGTSVLAGTAGATSVAINAGTLRLAAADRIADAAPVTVAAGAVFDLANNNETIGSLAGAGTTLLGTATLTTGGTNADTSYTGALTGTGDLTKTGTGTFTLIGNEALTGRLNANAGTLFLNGSTAGAVRVQGGTFAGNSTIAGALTVSSGTITPGSATQRVGQIQAASLATTGGTFAIDFGGSTSGFTADSLKITGAATLSGTTVTAAALDSSASYNFAQTYTVLTAGSIAGSFANQAAFAQVGTSTPDLYFRLRSDITPNAVVLEVRKIINFGATLGAGGTSNQISVGNALTAGELTDNAPWLGFLNTIANQTPAQRQGTFDSIGGESLADISTSAGMIGNDFLALLRQRLASGSAGDRSTLAGLLGGSEALAATRTAAPIDAAASSFSDGAGGSSGGAWVQGFGGGARLTGSNGTATLRDSSYGVAAGLDGRFGNLTLGGAFSAASLDAHIDARAARNKGTLYQGGGYLAYDDGQAFASLIGSYFTGDVDSSRQVFVGAAAQGTAVGRSRVHGFTAGAAAGYRMPIGDGSRFTPQASVQTTQVTRDAFTETGAGLVNLAAGRQRRDLYTATLQGRFSHVSPGSGWKVEPYIGAGASVQFGDRDAVAVNTLTGAPTGTGTFAIQGARLAPVVGLAELGIEAHPSDRVTLGLGAEGRLGNHQRDGSIQAHLRIGF